MKVIKVIEIIAGSPNGFEDAVQKALEQASKTVKNIKSIYVKDMNCNVENNKIVSWGVNVKISFELEGTDM